MSKFLYGIKPEGIIVRKREFLEKYGIDVKLESEVVSLDSNSNKVVLKNGEKIEFNKLLIATGGSARKPNVEGVNLKNVFVLRSVNDV